ncbi:MAG: AraC family transcriptional regulator [Spartobacteria bacterium]|nr:AraC family transcriptional regulator [Spartobacteria bacterium]
MNIDKLSNDLITASLSNAKYYFLQTNPRNVDPIEVVCGGREECDGNYYVSRETFRYHCIEYTAVGEGLLTLNGKEYTLSPGTIFHYGPGISHTIRAKNNGEMVKYFIDFCGYEAGNMIYNSPLSQREPLRVTTPQRIYEIFENLQRTGIEHTDFSTYICATLLNLLILRIRERAVPYSVSDVRALDTYSRCKRYIDNNYLTLKSLDDIVVACHVDKSYLCRIFKRFINSSPYKYLNHLKMNRAAQMLLDEQYLVREIADMLGFDDPYHFSRAFKKTFGTSPRHFVVSATRT